MPPRIVLAMLMATASGAALAAPTLDGTGFGSPTATVSYDPNAPTSNFGNPGSTTSGAAYAVYVRADSTYVYTLLQETGNYDQSAGTFANLYFGLGSQTAGSTYGIEVENNRSFYPGGNGTYFNNASSYGIASAVLDGGQAIEVAIPFSYFETDPQGIGFDKLTPDNPYVTLRLSQTFGYSVAGGASYGVTRLGQVVDPFSSTSPVPEPATLALLGAGLTAMAASRWRSRAN